MPDSPNGNGNHFPAKVAGSWVDVAGLWKFEGQVAEYLGPDQQQFPMGLAVCDVPFRDGKATTTLSLAKNEKTAAGILFGYHSGDSGYYALALGSHDRKLALTEYVPGYAWISLAGAGNVKNLVPNKEYRLALSISGQFLRVVLDDVPVISHVLRRPMKGTGLGVYAWGESTARFEKLSIEARDPKLFVIMPFKEPYDTIYREVIAPVAKELNFEVLRIDEVNGPGLILEDIQQEISRSHAVVAEVSSPNPNVFYELGYAHALGKPAVLLVRRPEEQPMPFDIKGYRAIFYDDSIGGKRIVERKLREHLKAVLQVTTVSEDVATV